MARIRTIIMGAAGRDFHNFNTFYRGNKEYEVVAFTATQIPNIEGRKYPAALAGELYPEGIPIYPESDLADLINNEHIDQVVFAYSDVPHTYVMHKGALVNAAGADFRMMGTKKTQIKSSKPVVAVCAVRTGSGKSQTTRRVSLILRDMGYKVAAIRHPMPYGDLVKQAVQRFADYSDLDNPDLLIVVADPHRPGHERLYYPGETNVRLADVFVINKVDTADYENVIMVRKNLFELNPDAVVIEGASPLYVDDPEAIRGKRVLVVEDGPTLTHGGMAYGAGFVAARRFGAGEIVDPRPFAVASIKATYEKYPDTGTILPAMGYGDEMMHDLEETINHSDVDLVISATPIDLTRIIKVNKPMQRVRYELQEIGEPTLELILKQKFG